ncbi:MAG: MipA/OmpV family protein [Nitrosomonadales bacterium]|nr:MipA/OmpV family protein [Nitrosomonadales bacterium]
MLERCEVSFSGKAAVVLGMCMTIISAANAAQAPLWEFGAGGAFIDFPHYRGSDERQVYVLPMPYLVYRGEILKVDRHRVRGMLYESETAELDVSVNGSVPVTKNDARQGMPDLDPTLEIGPAINVRLFEAESKQAQLELRLPLRYIIGSDFTYLRGVGWMFHPQLNLDVQNVFDQAGWNLGMAVGPLYTDRRYSEYFYGIDAVYARADRPAYSASGGYAGSQFVAALTKRFPKFWMSGFVKWDTLRGAAFETSPLVKDRQFATTGFAITWIFAESSTRVETDEPD